MLKKKVTGTFFLFVLFCLFFPFFSRGGGGKGGPEGWEAQHFALFFPLPPPFSFFFSFTGGLLVGFWWCFGGPGPSHVRVFAVGLSCESLQGGMPHFGCPCAGAWRHRVVFSLATPQGLKTFICRHSHTNRHPNIQAELAKLSSAHGWRSFILLMSEVPPTKWWSSFGDGQRSACKCPRRLFDQIRIF